MDVLLFFVTMSKPSKVKIRVRKGPFGRRRGSSPQRPASLVANHEFSVELHSRVVNLRGDVENRSDVLESFGTASTTKSRRSSAPSSPVSQERHGHVGTLDGKKLAACTWGPEGGFLYFIFSISAMSNCESSAMYSCNCQTVLSFRCEVPGTPVPCTVYSSTLIRCHQSSSSSQQRSPRCARFPFFLLENLQKRQTRGTWTVGEAYIISTWNL